MKKINLPYLRPLLNITKKEILDYLHKNKIKYLLDQTNNSDQFLRNRIRKYVVPAIQKCDERFDRKFESSLQQLQQENEFLKSLTKSYFKNVFKFPTKKDSYAFVGNLKTFLSLDKVLQKRILIEWFIKANVSFNPSQSYLNEVLRFLKNQNGGSHQLGTNWQVCKKKKTFWIKKV